MSKKTLEQQYHAALDRELKLRKQSNSFWTQWHKLKRHDSLKARLLIQKSKVLKAKADAVSEMAEYYAIRGRARQ